MLVRSLALAGAILLVAGLATTLVLAGSAGELAAGVRIAGVDVSGLTPAEAQALLEARSAEVASAPVQFVADDRSFPITPERLGVEPDWAAAVAAAADKGDGFAPLRGLRRLQLRLFGADVAPRVDVYDNALHYEVGRLADALARTPRNAELALRGLNPVVVPERARRDLDRPAAERAIVSALGSFERGRVTLPLIRDDPEVTAAALRPAWRQARVALSAPVRVTFGETRWRVPRWRIAGLIALPKDGSGEVTLTGTGAEKWFERLTANVGRPAEDASFAVDGTTVSVVPAADGFQVDTRETSKRLLAAVLSPTRREAALAMATANPQRSTADAAAMGITTQVGAYTTTYGGEPNRLHNVRLVAELIDGALVAPGAVFSFNGTTGARTADKGFLEAPVIINGELQTGLGGGVCQVSTTVFNAAYETGLPIESRTNHALYISHYPTGRDATVNYPDTDLRFRNDTSRWLLVRTWVGASSLTVALYGAPFERRVESETGPLVAVSEAPIERIKDPMLTVGESVVEEYGEPARRTSVHRRVYDTDGKLLYDTTWSSSYRSEPRVLRVGTKPKPKPKVVAPAEKPKDGTTTAPTETAPTETAPTDTTTVPDETETKPVLPPITG